ncbi:rhomboid family intramembrane serine protease [Brevundimonas sp.]|uniref:rhomboid family intramembrane serine protease n=1 Tax=Brevundimonas sp. TaxID=1871086 RepID=UPI001217C1AE|nr:rhomboid family intramembrane serine protease [Brevundimonas sp.]TAJ63900.1 MAG: rhomboid family intramembrane serine protease [Brevundimonas sp.]
MTDDALDPEPRSALQRASDGRPGAGAGVSFLDPRFWRAEAGAHAAPGLAAPGYLVIGICIVASVLGVLNNMRGGPYWDWGLSAQALAEGRWYALVSHMFAHAGPMHLFMNSTFLLGVGPVVMMRFGVGPSGWLRFAGLFLVSGLMGAAFYLALHLTGVVPMVGASGAICGLWGAASRIGPEGDIVPIRSAQVWEQVKAFAKMNVILFGILFVLVRMSGGVGGLAWEAHLGGFLFGLFAIPWIAPRRTPDPVFD